MRALFFLVLSHLSAVLAGGYQGCVERVWLFRAYEIDGLNAKDDQTIGFKCLEPETTTKSCDPTKWQPCTPKKVSGRDRCNFDEFLVSLGRAPGDTGWAVHDSTGKLDTEETAKNCYTRYTTAQGKNPKVKNFPPYVAVKDSWEFNDLIKRVGNTVDKVYQEKADDKNRHLWEGFDTDTQLIREARTGDHGDYLVRAARNKLSNKMDIETESLGTNPATGQAWETVDWKKTVTQAKANGVPDVDKEVRGFLNGFYRGKDTTAKDHLVVMRSMRSVSEKSQKCR